MSGYTLLVSLHVVIAILGTGQVAAIAIGGAVARRRRTNVADLAIWMRPLLLGVRVSLAAMFATGALLDVSADGAFHVWWWFRVSAMLLVVTFVLHALARSALTKGLADEAARDAVLRSVERAGLSMCGTVTLIAVLMQAKPF